MTWSLKRDTNGQEGDLKMHRSEYRTLHDIQSTNKMDIFLKKITNDYSWPQE